LKFTGYGILLKCVDQWCVKQGLPFLYKAELNLQAGLNYATDQQQLWKREEDNSFVGGIQEVLKIDTPVTLALVGIILQGLQDCYQC
jgi:hypothetical protein